MHRDLAGERWALVIVGLHSSGKSTLARLIASTTHTRVTELGDAVRSAARAQAGSSLVSVARDLLAADPLSLARSAVFRGAQPPASQIYVGPRTTLELEYLLRNLDGAVTVGLRTSPEIRKRRWEHRHLSFGDTWDEREWQESNWGTEKLLSECDIVINGGQDVERKVSGIIASIRDIAGAQ
ncbi:MAG: hypothetical protein ACJ71T_15605 [Actinomycetales bacterium]